MRRAVGAAAATGKAYSDLGCGSVCAFDGGRSGAESQGSVGVWSRVGSGYKQVFVTIGKMALNMTKRTDCEPASVSPKKRTLFRCSAFFNCCRRGGSEL